MWTPRLRLVCRVRRDRGATVRRGARFERARAVHPRSSREGPPRARRRTFDARSGEALPAGRQDRSRSHRGASRRAPARSAPVTAPTSRTSAHQPAPSFATSFDARLSGWATDSTGRPDVRYSKILPDSTRSSGGREYSSAPALAISASACSWLTYPVKDTGSESSFSRSISAWPTIRSSKVRGSSSPRSVRLRIAANVSAPSCDP